MFVLSGIIGALIGAMMTFGFNMWKFHRDERNARCDELCKAIWDAGVLASTYWATDFSEKDKQAIEEAKVIAAQTLIDGLYADFSEYCGIIDSDVDQNFSELLDALSGGDFSEELRSIDLERMSKAPRIASLTIISVRRAYRQTIPFHRVGRVIRDNRRRTLDMPSHVVHTDHQ